MKPFFKEIIQPKHFAFQRAKLNFTLEKIFKFFLFKIPIFSAKLFR